MAESQALVHGDICSFLLFFCIPFFLFFLFLFFFFIFPFFFFFLFRMNSRFIWTLSPEWTISTP